MRPYRRHRQAEFVSDCLVAESLDNKLKDVVLSGTDVRKSSQGSHSRPVITTTAHSVPCQVRRLARPSMSHTTTSQSLAERLSDLDQILAG